MVMISSCTQFHRGLLLNDEEEKIYRAVYPNALKFLGLGWMAKLTMPMLGKLWACISSQPGFWHVCMFCVL